MLVITIEQCLDKAGAGMLRNKPSIQGFRVYSILDFMAGLKNMQVCCQADATSLSPLVSNVIYVVMLKLQKFYNCICSYVTPIEIQVFCMSLWAFNYSTTGLIMCNSGCTARCISLE
jgi:hypothetical protein